MKNNYTILKRELDRLVGLLEDDTLDIDEAVKIYEKSQKIIVEMEAYLKKTEAKISKIAKK